MNGNVAQDCLFRFGYATSSRKHGTLQVKILQHIRILSFCKIFHSVELFILLVHSQSFQSQRHVKFTDHSNVRNSDITIENVSISFSRLFKQYHL